MTPNPKRFAEVDARITSISAVYPGGASPPPINRMRIKEMKIVEITIPLNPIICSRVIGR
jgi:hypothetical protein